MKNNKVLIATIVPITGGIPQMVHFVTQTLVERGYEPILAYYEPYSISPQLSVPCFKLFQRTVGSKVTSKIDGYEAHAIGAWLPELEFTHYLLTGYWEKLIESCKYHIAVSGNCLPCLPFVLTKKKYLAWIATPWREDRKDRVVQFPLYRKILDRLINGQVIRLLEKAILKRGTILALSHYTQKKINNLTHKNTTYDILPMPVDINTFIPEPKLVVSGRIGFSGRFGDPRKNIILLLEAISYCREREHDITVELIGDTPDTKLQACVEALNLRDHIIFVPYIPHDELPLHLQTFDAFVIPSHQEGLCIAALEAMSCGCPVVSTWCGGPEEFVIDGRTGYLVDFDAASMGDAILRIFRDRNLRSMLSKQARSTIEKFYSISFAKEKFWNAFERTFNQQETNK